MVNYEAPPEDNPELVIKQWYGDAGVGRGATEEFARDMGYTDPAELPTQSPTRIEVIVEAQAEESPIRTTNHVYRHPRPPKRSPAQHPRVRQSPAYDKVIPPEMRLPRFPPVDSETAQSARNIVDGDTAETPSSEIV